MEIKDKILDIEDVKKSKISLASLFIRKTAVMTSVPESIVEKVIKDQWENANKQTKEGSSISEIDFPNLGIFFISGRKSKKKIDTLNKSSITLKGITDNVSSTENEKKKALEMINRNNNLIKSINLKLKTKN